MRALKFKVNRQALGKMYFTFIRPLLEYSDSVWDNCSNEAKRQLDFIHHEAARIITGGTKLCSLEKLLADLGWDSLEYRRTKHKLNIFNKIINNLSPNYLQDCVPLLFKMVILIDLGIQAVFALFTLIQICFTTRFIPQQLENGIT